MKRKNYWLLFGILLLSLTSLSPSFDLTHKVGGDKPGNDPLPPSQPPDQPKRIYGPIKIGVQMEDREFRELVRLNAEMMKTTGAKADITQLGDFGNDIESLIRTLSLGEGPDVLLIDSHWIKPLAMKGLLLPMEASQAVSPDSQLPGGLLEPVQWNGFQWGIPFDMDPYVLAWKTDIAGEELPGNRKGWQSLKKKQDGKPLFSLDPRDPYAFAAVIHTLGGNPEKPEQELLDLLMNPSAPAPWFTFRENAMDLVWGVEETSPVFVAPLSAVRGEYAAGYRVGMPSEDGGNRRPVVRSRSFVITSQGESAVPAMSWIAEMTSPFRSEQWTKASGMLSAAPVSVTEDPWRSKEGVSDAVERLRQELGRKPAAVLQFGEENGFAEYRRSAEQLLDGVLSVEDYRKQYAESKVE